MDREIIEKLNNLENIIEELYKEIIKIRKNIDDRKHEEIHIMTRIENINDFIETRYNTSI